MGKGTGMELRAGTVESTEKKNLKRDLRCIDPPSLGRGLALVVDKADLLGRRQGSVDRGVHVGRSS